MQNNNYMPILPPLRSADSLVRELINSVNVRAKLSSLRDDVRHEFFSRRKLMPRFLIAMILAAVVVSSGCAQTGPETKTATVATASPATTAESVKPDAAPAPALAPDLATNPPPPAAVINPALPSIFIAGDSTAARGAGTSQQGWAVPFATYFDPTKVNIVNRARGGRSSRTFITEGLWDQLLANVKRGDIVLIQFGHNDAGAINDDRRARGSLPGLGGETQEIDNLITEKARGRPHVRLVSAQNDC